MRSRQSLKEDYSPKIVFRETTLYSNTLEYSSNPTTCLFWLEHRTIFPWYRPRNSLHTLIYSFCCFIQIIWDMFCYSDQKSRKKKFLNSYPHLQSMLWQTCSFILFLSSYPPLMHIEAKDVSGSNCGSKVWLRKKHPHSKDSRALPW